MPNQLVPLTIQVSNMSGNYNTGHRLDFTQVSNQVPLTIQLVIYLAKGPLIFSDAHGDNVIQLQPNYGPKSAI